MLYMPCDHSITRDVRGLQYFNSRVHTFLDKVLHPAGVDGSSDDISDCGEPLSLKFRKISSTTSVGKLNSNHSTRTLCSPNSSFCTLIKV